MAAASRTPTAEQLAYQARELTMFVHFSMCTFTGCEQDTACRSSPPSIFNPTALNATQWVATAKAMGAKEVCLTAHHTGGFALWPSRHTNYSIAHSPYKGGGGDIVREFTQACAALGVSPCLYFINAWDCWESGDSPDLYLQRQLGMLSELLDRQRYGAIDRLWFDQYGFASRRGESPPGLFPAAWEQVVAHVRSVSPGTMMLPGPDGCLNPGEGGGGAYPIVGYTNDTLACSYHDGDTLGAQWNAEYVPYESDISIQNPGDAWFYHAGHPYLSAEQLWSRYLAVVGRGSHFIVNMPPNRSGLVVDGFVEAAAGLGRAVADSFGADAGRLPAPITAPCSQLQATVRATGSFDAVVLQEGLARGQSILGYSLELMDAATQRWTPVPLDKTTAGLTVNHKAIVQLPGGVTNATAVRFTCTRAIAAVDAASGTTLAALSLHTLRGPPQPPARRVSLRSYVSDSLHDTAPCATRDGGACSTYTAAQYRLLREEAIVLDRRNGSDPSTKYLDLVYSLAAGDNGLSDVIAGKPDPAYAPPGYADYSDDDRVAVYTEAGTGRIPLESYYSGALKDFWVVGSAASRAEALAKGYAKVGVLGYGLAP